MQVRDLMQTNVFTVRGDQELIVVAEIMNWAHIRHVPVVDAQGELLGVISHRDLIRHLAAPAPGQTSTPAPNLVAAKRATVQLADVMSPAVHVIGPDDSVQEAAARMRTERIGCLPVIRGARLVGIVTATDLLRIVERISPDGFVSDWFAGAAS